VIGLLVWLLPFRWIERVFGLAGLTIVVFAAGALVTDLDWAHAARDLLPNWPAEAQGHATLYAYLAIGVISSLMMPYEVYFYSSGGIEEKWKPRDLPMNVANTCVGFVLGAAVAMAILVLAAKYFEPRRIDPQLIGTPALLVGIPFGHAGVVLGVVGILTAVAGAAVETALAGAYNWAQYFGLPWGRAQRKFNAPVFNAVWIVFLALGALVNLSGIDPIELVELSVMFAVVCLPFTYLPILLTARDRKAMGKHANSRWIDAIAWFYLALITLCGIAAPVLLVLTWMGKYG
jgi:Mn2+/Fe2+ NRAMP family transporter